MRQSCVSLSGHSAIRHQPDQAAHPAHPQPDRAPPDRGAERARTTAPAAAHARRVPSARPTRFLRIRARSEEHTSELQSLMRISYAVFCLKNKNNIKNYYHRAVTKTTARKINKNT